jgi:hypothetical protein
MSRVPPMVASLLDDLGRSDLVGDLSEDLGHGRSPAWVWWQALAAIAQGVWGVLRHHWYLTFRAATVGWITFQIVNGQLPFSSHPEFRVAIGRSPIWVVIVAAQYFVSGWVVGRLHPRYRIAFVTAATAFLMMTSFTNAALRTWLILDMTRFGLTQITLPSLIGQALTDLALPLATLLGGILGHATPALSARRHHEQR